MIFLGVDREADQSPIYSVPRIGLDSLPTLGADLSPDLLPGADPLPIHSQSHVMCLSQSEAQNRERGDPLPICSQDSRDLSEPIRGSGYREWIRSRSVLYSEPLIGLDRSHCFGRGSEA